MWISYLQAIFWINWLHGEKDIAFIFHLKVFHTVFFLSCFSPIPFLSSLPPYPSNLLLSVSLKTRKQKTKIKTSKKPIRWKKNAQTKKKRNKISLAPQKHLVLLVNYLWDETCSGMWVIWTGRLPWENLFPICQEIAFLVRVGTLCPPSLSQCWDPVWLEPVQPLWVLAQPLWVHMQINHLPLQ